MLLYDKSYPGVISYIKHPSYDKGYPVIIRSNNSIAICKVT